MDLRDCFGLGRAPAGIAAQIWRPQRDPTKFICGEGRQVMNLFRRALTAILFVPSFAVSAGAQNTASPARHITLSEAVQLALKRNHVVRIADLKVDEKQDAKEIARSAYLPSIRNESRIARVTDTQFIEIARGSLGTVAGTPIPQTSDVISQGGRTFVTSGTTLVQPISQLFTRIKPANEAAQADLNASRADAQETQNEVALKVHQIYYQLLVAQLRSSAAAAKIRAHHDLASERIEQVKYGSALDQSLIESRAQLLQAKQDLLTTDLQISNLTMQLDDVMGLPVTTALTLDTNIPAAQEPCQREGCVQIARESHPEVVAARAEVQKASAGVRLAKADYLPDVSAFARYSYQSNVPFLVHNFGTFGGQVTYDLFDGGRRRAASKESHAKLAQAKENLARVTDDVELRVETALNKLDRTKEMVNVSEQLLALRKESSRVTAEQLLKGEALQSQVDAGLAEELDAKAVLLAAQLDYVQAHDELLQAMGLTP
jgi:outer membrane protein TolC